MPSFFRQEALEAREGEGLGRVRTSTSLPWWGVTLVAGLLAAMLVAYSFVGEITRKAQVTGILVPTRGQIDVHAASAGRIAELRVTEGQSVRQGEVIAVLALDRGIGTGELGAEVARQIQSRRATLEAERTLRSAQFRMQQQSLAARVEAMDSERSRADDEISLTQRRLALAQQQALRVEQLLAAGFLPVTQAQQQQQELIDVETRLQQLARTRISLTRDRAMLAAEGNLLSGQLRTELAQLDRAIATLEQEAAENEARRLQVITAPQDARITLLPSKVGQPVQPGQLVASAAPAEAGLEAQLFATSQMIGFAKAGQTVHLRYAAFPYQKFGLQKGLVASISSSPVAPSQLPVALAHVAHSTRASEALYRLTVQLASQHVLAYGVPTPLRAGMTVEATVVLDRRRFIEWLFQPVLEGPV